VTDKANKASIVVHTKEELFRLLDDIRVEAPPLEPLWGYFLFRKHITSIVGDPGICKCIDENTLIPIEDGRLVPVKDYCQLYRVLTLDRNLKIVGSHPVVKLDEGFKKCLRVVTHLGKEIVVTPEHPFLKVDGWCRADRMRKGDRIAMARIVPIEGNRPMPENRIKLLAYLITEGTLQRTPSFTTANPTILADFQQSLADWDNIQLNLKQRRGKTKTYSIVAIKPQVGTKYRVLNGVAQWLEELSLLETKSREKFIPDCIFQLPNDGLSLFLNRMFATDGCSYCSSRNHYISYFSTSHKLVSQLQHLLLRFGIISRIATRNSLVGNSPYKSYVLSIKDSLSQLKFIDRIGIFTQEPMLQAIKERIQSCSYNPNLDTVPTLRNRINGVPVKRSISRNRLHKLEPDNILASSDIYWDSIEAVEDAGVRHVYDISMPMRNFIANDFIVHNTTFGYGLGMALCRGQEFLDIKPEEPAKLLYMDFESSDSLVSSRASLLTTERVPNFYVFNVVDYYLVHIYEHMIDFCREKDINLVIVDNQSMAFSTRDENDNAEAIRQMRFLRDLVHKSNVAMIVFHHTSKANLSGTRKGTGAYARARLADVCINLEYPDEEKKDIVRLSVAKNRLVDEQVMWYLKKEDGKFVFTEPPLGASGQPTGTAIYKAQQEILSIVNGQKEFKYEELVSLLSARKVDRHTVGNALKRLVQQGRLYKPKYGYYARKIVR
jgi:intein/homing endonuclease